MKRSLLLCIGLLATSLAQAELRTLTDTQGRTVEADVLAVTESHVKIRRTDGNVFELPLDRLRAEDQQALRLWAQKEKAKPHPIPPGAFEVNLSRARFGSETVETDVNLVGGGVVKNGRSTTEEKWGYTVSMYNRTNAALTGLRAEYMLFATMDDVHTEGKKEGLRRTTSRAALPDVPSFGRAEFRTDTVSTFTMKYKGNIRSANTGDRKSRESLAGVWIKIYRGDELIYEASLPDGLRKTERW